MDNNYRISKLGKYLPAQIERIGTARFVERLYQENIKVSYPDIDDGVDLIAYVDQAQDGIFRAVPLQLKCYSEAGFNSDRKYLSNVGLIIVYVWHITDGKNLRIFCMPYRIAEDIVDSKGWSRNSKKQYSRSGSEKRLGKPMVEALSQYEVPLLYPLLFADSPTTLELAK